MVWPEVGDLIALQMDLPERLNPATDSTLLLAREAARRGFEVYVYQPSALTYSGGVLTARAQRWPEGGEAVLDLATAKVVLLRQDPPFDMAYITSTYLLELLPPAVRVLNNPRAVRDAPEKLLVQRFAEFTPPTLITRDRAAIAEFREAEGDVIIKPLYGHGGAGVSLLKAHSDEGAALEGLLAAGLPIIVQRYLPAVRAGDKRIVLIDGKVAGAINRVPAAHEVRANLVLGGRAEKTTLTQREAEICEAVGPYLQQQGLYLVGLDVIGGFLTEINVTSPTGLVAINQLDGTALERVFWDGVGC